MLKTLKFIIFIAFTAIVLASEVEDNEQKKRGASKASGLNAIPTGSQKPDYTFNLYSQNSGQSSPSQTYQSQVPSSFYPSHVSNQYFTPANIPSSSQPHAQTPTPSSNSQFVPINYVPSSGYQSKYQIVPQKQIGNVHLAIMQSTIPSSSFLQYPQSLFSSSPTNHVSQGAVLGQGHYGFAPNFQTLPIGGHFIGQPSMIVLPQSHPSLFNQLVYPNPTQSFYNYYPSVSQPKYSYSSGSVVSPSNEYDKSQSSVPQNIIKEESGNGEQTGEHLATDSNTYSHTFTSRSTYPKK